MATARIPPSAMSRSSEKRQTGSGVVSEGGTTAFAYRAPSVPMRPHATPASPRIFAIISTVVVLPFVPVTPTIFISRSGWR